MTIFHANAQPRRRNVGRWASGRTPALDLSAAIAVMADAGRQATGVMSSEGALREACSILLEAALSTTGAEYGFCGPCRYDESGQPYLFTLALTNIAWNEETAKIYAQFLSEGLEFRKLDTLYGAVLTSKQFLLTRDAPSDPHATGTPHGHPVLERFMGIPVLAEEELIGMIGLANFDDELSDADLYSRAELIALASVGSFALVESSESAEMHRRVSRHNRFDLLQRTIGGFAHEFNNDLMCLTIGLPMLSRSKTETAEQREIWQELQHSIERMKDEVRSLKRFVAMTQSELELPSLCQLAGQMIELLTLCTCTVRHQQDLSGLLLSVPEPAAMTWIMEAILALQSVDDGGQSQAISLTTHVCHEELTIGFEIEGGFHPIGDSEAMAYLVDDCASLGATVHYAFPKLKLLIPAHKAGPLG